MGMKFWIGVGLAVAGIVLMSIPDKGCVDCDDEQIPYLAEDGETVLHRESDEVAGD